MTRYEKVFIPAGQFLATGKSFEHFPHVVNERKWRAPQAVLGKMECVRGQHQRSARRRDADDLKPAGMAADPV